jgi:iron complex outermembrane receptor protein
MITTLSGLPRTTHRGQVPQYRLDGEGRLGALEALYTGAYTERTTDQIVDYSDYLFVGQYLPYYICDGSVTYPAGAPTGTC